MLLYFANGLFILSHILSYSQFRHLHNITLSTLNSSVNEVIFGEHVIIWVDILLNPAILVEFEWVLITYPSGFSGMILMLKKLKSVLQLFCLEDCLALFKLLKNLIGFG